MVRREPALSEALPTGEANREARRGVLLGAEDVCASAFWPFPYPPVDRATHTRGWPAAASSRTRTKTLQTPRSL